MVTKKSSSVVHKRDKDAVVPVFLTTPSMMRNNWTVFFFFVKCDLVVIPNERTNKGLLNFRLKKKTCANAPSAIDLSMLAFVADDEA
jgi:hypothetical protein